MQRDVNKLLPQSKEITLLRNSVESAQANINSVGSVVVAVNSGIDEVKSDVPKTVSEVSNLKTHILGVLQEIMSLKTNNHGAQSKMVSLKLQSEAINENELANVKAEVGKIQSHITSIKDIFGNLSVHVEAMKSGLIPPPVIGTGRVPDLELTVAAEELPVDIQSDPGSNGKQMQSLDCSGLLSLNPSEDSFKPPQYSKTCDKPSTTADR